MPRIRRAAARFALAAITWRGFAAGQLGEQSGVGDLGRDVGDLGMDPFAGTASPSSASPSRRRTRWTAPTAGPGRTPRSRRATTRDSHRGDRLKGQVAGACQRGRRLGAVVSASWATVRVRRPNRPCFFKLDVLPAGGSTARKTPKTFGLSSATSQRLQLKLRDVAERLVLTGKLPDIGAK